MKKTVFLCFMLATAMYGKAANSLLSAPVSGPLGHSKLEAMSIAANGTDVVLLLSDKTSLYALDIDDNKASEATANTITSIPNFVDTKLKPVAGGATLTVLDIEVNPISKSVYVLAEAAGTSYVFKVRNNGATVTLVNLSAISHSTISWGASFDVMDMTWGNDKLYASSGSFSLTGSVATVASPFAHGSSISQRSTSMFKSNWGGSYFTTAPLETMTYGMVKTKHRLMGVTTCAPGFSLDIAGLAGSGALQVTEDFNINMGTSKKVVFQHHDSKDWLFDLHDNKLYRIGESLIDGSPVTAGQHNNNSLLTRDFSGAVSPGVVADVFKSYTGLYKVISFWDNYRLLVLEDGGTLKLMQTATTIPTAIQNIQAGNNFSIYPNPAHHTLNVSLSGTEETTLQIFSMEGKMIQTTTVNAAGATLDISSLAAGQYILKAISGENLAGQQIFVVQ